MVILIAESKTMETREKDISAENYEAHKPVGEDVAEEVMGLVATMPVADIATEVKVSNSMAMKISRMAYEFPNKSLGLRAIEAYTGVVFRAFDYGSLSEDNKERADSDVRIISSLYGWLRPADVIKAYRFDFNTPLAPDFKTFYAYWRKDVTMELVKHLRAVGENVVLNLLPADAGKCIDWKLVKNFAKVWKVDFKDANYSGEWKTPNAGKLKALRGELLRNIITQGIETPDALEALVTPSLIPLGKPDYPDRFAFCTLPD